MVVERSNCSRTAIASQSNRSRDHCLTKQHGQRLQRDLSERDYSSLPAASASQTRHSESKNSSRLDVGGDAGSGLTSLRKTADHPSPSAPSCLEGSASLVDVPARHSAASIGLLPHPSPSHVQPSAT